MNANHFHVGHLVSATDPAKIAALCATYIHDTIHGVIVALDRHRVAVKWIDYRGPQHETYLVAPSLLCVGTLATATRTRVFPRRRTATMHPATVHAVAPDDQPSIEIRELKIHAGGDAARETATRLQFHTIEDANIALHAIADAQEAFQWTFGPDLASTISGAYIVAVYRAMYTTLYRLDRVHVDAGTQPAPAAVAG